MCAASLHVTFLTPYMRYALCFWMHFNVNSSRHFLLTVVGIELPS